MYCWLLLQIYLCYLKSSFVVQGHIYTHIFRGHYAANTLISWFCGPGSQIILYESYCTAIKSLTDKIAKLQRLI